MLCGGGHGRYGGPVLLQHRSGGHREDIYESLRAGKSCGTGGMSKSRKVVSEVRQGEIYLVSGSESS